MSASLFHPALRVVRSPSESGPLICCAGELGADTAEMLRQELQSLLPLGHPQLTVDFSRCRVADVAGMVTVLETLKEASESGTRVAVIPEPGWMARLLRVAGFDRFLAVYPDETTAAAASPMGPPARAPLPWEAAREATLAYWSDIRDVLDWAATAEIERRLTAMTAFCEGAGAIHRGHQTPAAYRCQHCPLFYALGGLPSDVGCRSLRDPILAAVRTGDRGTARSLVDRAISILDEMTLPPARYADET
jgi:anti-anti-sigma regulatory factor